jgi:hypothetical protein
MQASFRSETVPKRNKMGSALRPFRGFFLIMLRRLIRSARVLIKHAMVDDEQDWGLNACQKCRPEGSASFRQLRAGA